MERMGLARGEGGREMTGVGRTTFICCPDGTVIVMVAPGPAPAGHCT